MRAQRQAQWDSCYGLRALKAQRYAENQRSLVKDAPLVTAAFPDVDIEVLSPAFLNPETVPSGFAENIAPPTDQETLGTHAFPYNLSTG